MNSALPVPPADFEERLRFEMQQKQPSSDCAGISDILLYALGQYPVLYALLAGYGPTCAGEALGLEAGRHISEDLRTLYIRQKAKRGEIQQYLKTRNLARLRGSTVAVGTTIAERGRR